MKKISEILAEIDQKLEKEAFIPNPQVQQQSQANQQSQQMMQQVAQMVQQLPPEMQQQVAPQLEQISQLPPDQQAQALQQIMQGLAQAQQEGGGEGADKKNSPIGPDSDKSDGAQDIYTTKVTMTVKDLLDLVSGGKASMTHAKIQSIAQKHKMDQDKMTQDAENQKQQMAMEAQQQQQAAAASGPNLQQGGIYPQPQQ